jgi:predicted DNA-binding transcriptional regulator AlpA
MHMDTNNDTPPPDRLIRLPEVLRRTGMSRSWLYDAMRTGSFPTPVRIGERAVAWHEADLTQWLASRVRARPETP